MGAQQLFLAPYNPSTNGTVERVDGTLISILCKLDHSDPLHWDFYLPSALMAYQISYHWILKTFLFKALYGQEPGIPAILSKEMEETNPQDPDANLKHLAQKIVLLQSKAMVNLDWTVHKESETLNASRHDLPTFELSDQVMYYHNKITTQSHKLGTIWEGPYIVTYKRGAKYSIKSLASGVTINQVHSRFLCCYTPTNLEGGDVGLRPESSQIPDAITTNPGTTCTKGPSQPNNPQQALAWIASQNQ